MKEAITGLFDSKKAVAALAGSAASAIVATAGSHGWVVDQATAELLVKGIIAVTVTYILGQGAADLGKEKAKIESQAVSQSDTSTETKTNK